MISRDRPRARITFGFGFGTLALVIALNGVLAFWARGEPAAETRAWAASSLHHFAGAVENKTRSTQQACTAMSSFRVAA